MPKENRNSNKQHIYPKSLIIRFLKDDKVHFRSKQNSKFHEGKNTSRFYAHKKLWDERSEKGWMKEIEDSLSNLCRKIDDNKPLRDEDHKLITEFYLLWYCRSYSDKYPKDKNRMIHKSEHLEEFRQGRLNTSLLLAAYQSSIETIPLETIPNGFDYEKGHICEIRYLLRKKLSGNQFLNSSRVLMSPPNSSEHAASLESNIPWSSTNPNISSVENINNREGVHYFDEQGYMPSQIANGLWIQKSHDMLRRRFHNLKWGILIADCGEFVVPTGINSAWLVPISPTIALIANIVGTHDITCGDIKNLNNNLIQHSELWMSQTPENTMLNNENCPNFSK